MFPSRRTALVPVALLFLVSTAFVRSAIQEMPDFEVYWRAGHRVVAAEPLYRDEDGHFRHKYWPVFALLMAPLALLPLPVAKAVWFYLSIAAIVAFIALSLRLLPRPRQPPWLLVTVTFAAMLKFYAHEVNLGQCNAFMALAVLAAIGLLMRERPAPAGVLLALATAIKPYPLVFVPYLLLRRRFAALTAFLLAVLAGLAVPAAVYGAGGNAGQLAAWLATVSESTRPNLLNQDNVSIWAMYAKWFHVGRPAFVLAAITIAAIAAAAAALVQRGGTIAGSEYLDGAALLVLIPLLSPQGWDYALLMATPAVMLFVNASDRLPPAVRTAGAVAIAVSACAVFDLLGRRGYAAFMATSAITICALVLLGSIAVIRTRRLA